ncbi:MAG TPA: ATP-dependent DNA helicase [Kofleriaceae bacterium]|nr:ATP-dependent DNA helicase [Kofleriaceae bacterium]
MRLFAPDGALARTMPGYEDRPQQRAMAAAVAAALEDTRALLCEAGTGTGKTLAYLVPAAASGRRVVISTGTRALQEQLTQHDVPLAERALGRPIRAAVLKGVSNYLCKRKASALELMLPGSGEELDAIRGWLLRTETGDRGELGALGDDSPWWPQLTTTPDSRVGPRCAHFEGCWVTQARRAAEKAELVIVNHHLYFADLALRASSPGARVLPEHDAVIFDEAHLLEEVMTEHFGFGVSTTRVALLARDLAAAGHSPGTLERAATDFFDRARAALAGAAAGDAARVALPEGMFAEPALQAAWFGLDGALESAALAAAAAEARGDDDGRTGPEAWGQLARRAGAARAALADLAEADDGRRAVRWGEVRGAGVSLRASPIDVSHILRERVLPSVPTAIFTSATLTAAGRFTYVRERLGLSPDDADELRVDSPFDYGRQAMLYVARDLPAPADSSFTAAAAARAAELIDVTGGSAFVLFTSHRALREAADILRARLPYPLMVQGQAPPAALLDRFRAVPGSVLLATGTFWAGVDVPGSALSLVIMDKLPFASPGDPLAAARAAALEAADRDPFSELSVPHAALTFRQGFGRLIRRRDDRGIAAVLDGRLLQKSYGRDFLGSLPPALPRTSALEQVRRWWRTEERAAG